MTERVGGYPRPNLSDFSSSELTEISEKETFRTLSAPVTVQWELTPWCNENCVHCYNYWRREEVKKLSITPNTTKLYETTSREIIKNRVFHVTLTGGEPLAVLHWAYPYLKELADNNISIGLNSNLTMLTTDKAKLLKELGVRSILTSLMAADPGLNDRLANTHGAFERVTKGIQMALKEGFWVGVNMVVTKKNLGEIFSTAEYVKNLGVTAFSATKASTPINSPDFSEYMLSKNEFRFMLRELMRVRSELNLDVDSLEFYPMCFFNSQETRGFFGNRICNAGKTACTIGHDGSIRPCSHANQIYGFIHKDGGLKQTWLNLHPWRTNAYIPNECNECNVKNICRGGCRTEAYALSGDLQAPDPYCDFSHPILPKTVPERMSVGRRTEFVFHPGIKFRKEDFGGILFVTPIRWSAVTHKLYDFYIKKRGKTFYLGELAAALKTEVDQVISTAEILLYKTVIKEKGGD
jgi:radical SAM protein with 4Fe4S-binding SPASM domain